MRKTHIYLAALAVLGLSLPAAAQTVELKIQHFLPAGAPSQTSLIEPWAKAVEQQSQGRIKSHLFPAMQLGGKPPELSDQVREGRSDTPRVGKESGNKRK